MYGKLFESTFNGSMVGSGPEIFAVWAYVLAHVRNGSVELNSRIIATVIGMEEASVVRAIETFCAPDQRSRNKAHEGRRLIRSGEFLYKVTGWAMYSKILDEDDRREYFRMKKRESRARAKVSTSVKDKSTSVKDKSTIVKPSTHTDTEKTRSTSSSVSAPSSGLSTNPQTTPHPSPSGSGAPSPVQDVVDFYVAKRPSRRPGAKERSCIAQRLKEGFTVAELCEAIDGCLAKPFVSDSGKVFDGLELICRNSAKVNQFRSQSAAERKDRESRELEARAQRLGLPAQEASRGAV